MPAADRSLLRRRLFIGIGIVVLLVLGVGYSAVSRAPTALRADGPTAVAGTDASAVFRIADRKIRQVRYHDRGTLDYTFTLTNDQSLPVTVAGMSEDQKDARLFRFLALEDNSGAARFTVPAHGASRVHLRLRMTGCESLSARAGSFVHRVLVDTSRLGVPAGTATITLPEELHTGSPREAFCPKATAKSRPPG